MKTPSHNEKTPDRSLSDGLNLKTASTQKELNRVAEFNRIIHQGEDVRGLVTVLTTQHPEKNDQRWFYIEDQGTGKIVSSLCLIPWAFLLCGKKIKACELGFVGTLEEFRNRGLIRILMDEFHRIAVKEKYIISLIEGIPNYYRQFGYEYAIPFENHINAELRTMPAMPAGFFVRKAREADIPSITRMYEAAVQKMDLSSARTPEIWKYLFGKSMKTELARDTFIVESGARLKKTSAGCAGYFRIARHGFGDGLILDETSRLDFRAIDAVLAFSGKLATERKKPYVRINLPLEHPVSVRARGLGAPVDQQYGWQVRIEDVRGLLKTIAPVLEKRLAESVYKGLTGTIDLNLYKRMYQICFEIGRIREIRDAGSCAESAVMIPFFAATQLFLGWKTFAELRAWHPDVRCADNSQAALFEVLFPKLYGWLHAMY